MPSLAMRPVGRAVEAIRMIGYKNQGAKVLQVEGELTGLNDV
jgi:hypothetical protein